MKTQTKTGKGRYDAPECTDTLFFSENYIMTGSNFSVNMQDYTVDESEDDDWM